jgi:hypothetical protein
MCLLQLLNDSGQICHEVPSWQGLYQDNPEDHLTGVARRPLEGRTHSGNFMNDE